MSYYCQTCSDKLETLQALSKITNIGNGGWFSTGGIEWSSHVLLFCDNEDCERVGVLLAMASKERPKATRLSGEHSASSKLAQPTPNKEQK